ncbi:hypothetical protein Ddye_025840 [Dipteronia dyeriana]|uniref:Uncharacterized protein n=1 Tax=Dipteronia dyeriana TaxID=168575 RepID=A0AAD9TL15_9ROSI|nr:hypothetical protein Ddye_025840 [Dipteronia dyeriana]
MHPPALLSFPPRPIPIISIVRTTFWILGACWSRGGTGCCWWHGMALAVDPLFFYVFSLQVGEGGAPFVYLDAQLAAIVTVLRTCIDVVHLCHLWLQFRMAYVSRDSLVVGCGKLVWDARAIARHYLLSFRGF